MCGITGYIGKNPINFHDFYDAHNKISHRGPDGEGFITKNEDKYELLAGPKTPKELQINKHILAGGQSKFVLGHHRLSIQDLSASGHQPMIFNELVLAFNGEIFNFIEIKDELRNQGYSFTTGTDSEVILKSYDYWGKDCFKKFEGMWSIVILDKKRNELLLTRDRFGIKPLYYFHDSSQLIFGSEIKFIKPLVSPSYNQSAINKFIKYGDIDCRQQTFFENVRSINPSYIYRINLSSLEISKSKISYNNIQESINDFDTAKERFRDHLIQSVNLRLRSDVPYGLMLSGGLDSNAILSTMIKILNGKKKIETYTYLSKDGEGEDFLAEKSIELNQKYISSNILEFENQKIQSDYSQTILVQDQPIRSFSPVAQRIIYKEVNKIGITKVLLNGQGADEFLGGYNKQIDFYLASLLLNFSYAEYMEECHAFEKKNRLKEHVKILAKHFLNLDKSQSSEYWSLDTMRSCFLNNIYHRNLPEFLRYDDHNSMSNSIESRLPFLDFKLTDFIFSQNTTHKISNGKTKKLLREAVKESIIQEIYNGKNKYGFGTSQETLLNGPLSAWAKERLNPKLFKNPEKFIHNDMSLLRVISLSEWENLCL
jgi:asparagine synthase (glutamine-hydrolysing)